MKAESLFIAGMLTSAYAVAGVFFLRFWVTSKDRLFAIFATSFFVLGLQRVALVAASRNEMDTTWIYVIRLVAFLLIIFAIIDKNRSK